MNIKITCSVKNENKDKVKIVIYEDDIEEIILRKAKAIGVKGYEGRLIWHFDEKIESVSIAD